MSDLNEKITAAWLEASKDLGIAVVVPYRVETTGPTPLWSEAFIPDFGSPTGAVVISSMSRRMVRPVLREGKRWHSELGNGYGKYSRQHFIETLNDWGWFGQEHLRPDWYTGDPWS